MTRYDPATHDPVVRRLFQCQFSDEQIAERVGVKAAVIGAARCRMGLGRPKGRVPIHAKPEAEPPPRAIDANSPMAVAFATFGARLVEAGGCYRLDGTPIRFFDLMRATNRLRTQQGLAQVGHADWRVQP